jgi:hypothetical protein
MVAVGALRRVFQRRDDFVTLGRVVLDQGCSTLSTESLLQQLSTF